MRNVNGHSIYEFGEFTLDVDRLMLYRDETEISLPPKVVKTLAVLVENRGEILSKEELMEKVWEDSIVEESNLSQYLYLLRKTVGNKPDGNPYIETLRRRGYRFKADVRCLSIDRGQSVADQSFAPRSSLIGRAKELEEISDLISREDVRLVTLSGVGGVGKTTLARAIADQQRGEHEVFFVELAAITRPELVVSAIGSALGVKEAGSESALDRIKECLQGRSVLLVLDNFEQVASAAPVVADLAHSSLPLLKILVTSRVTLRVGAEAAYVLSPLGIPKNDLGPDPLEKLSRCESVNLFVERAKGVQARFELTPENAEDVARICTRLEGLPLAIELAAARMRLMSPGAVLKRLQKQLDILRGSSSEAPARQQTMRATIAWSYDLLTDLEKRVFARLGVFAGGFDLEAAESVCDDLIGSSTVSFIDDITSLVEHNLLVARNVENGAPRIQMLEVVREFAEEVLVETGQIETARRAHAEYFLRLGEEAEPQLIAARSAEWLARLETEHDNLRAALEWSTRNDPAIGQRLAGSIWRFWWLHGHVREACEQLETFLAIASTDPGVRAKMLTGATFLNRLAGRSECSHRYAEEGVKLAAATGDLRTGALSLNQLGFLALDEGNLREAERRFTGGLQQAEKLGDIQILALLNNGLGELSRMKGDYDRAAEFYGRALDYNREAGDRVRQTTCLINLGATAVMREDREAAGSFYRQGLEISSEMEDMNGTLYCLEGLAGSYWALRDPGRSALLFGAAHAGRQENNLLLEHADKIPYDKSVTLVRDAIGIVPFNESFSKGTKMNLKAAADLALEEIATTPGQKRVQSESPARGGRIAVERHGNVLRLVDWSDTAEQENETPAVEPAVAGQSPPKSHSRAVLLAAIGAASIVILVLALFWFIPNDRSELSVKNGDINITRLTKENYVHDATISRDGNYFAYSEPAEGTSRIWIQQTGQAGRVEILPAGTLTHGFKTFSPDGKFLYFVGWKDNEKPALYRVPTFGGNPEKVLGHVNSWVSFSPDGTELIFLRREEASGSVSFVIGPSNGKGTERRVSLADSGLNIYSPPAWSPDGKTIVFAAVTSDEPSPPIRLFTLDLEAGITRAVSDEVWGTAYRIEWLRDGSAFALIGTRQGETLSTRRDQVYLVSYPDGRSRRLTTDGSRHEPESLGVTDGGSILAVSFNRASQIWSMDAGGDSRTAEQLTMGVGEGRGGIATLPDGRIGYVVLGEGGVSLWTIAANGSDKKRLLPESHIEMLGATPDGNYFVFRNRVGDHDQLYRVAVDGGEPVQLTFDDVDTSNKGYLSVSPDGLWVAYDSSTIKNGIHSLSIKRVPIGGGQPVVLVEKDCQGPEYSPDGRYIVCSAKNGFAIRSAGDGSVVATFDRVDFAFHEPKWTPDSQSLVYIVHQNNVCNLWKQPINGSKPERLTDFTSGQCHNFAYSRDGSRIYLARGYEARDAILIGNYK